MLDAIGDFNIFAMGICEELGTNLEALILATWATVKQRDWVADPEKGVPA